MSISRERLRQIDEILRQGDQTKGRDELRPIRARALNDWADSLHSLWLWQDHWQDGSAAFLLATALIAVDEAIALYRSVLEEGKDEFRPMLAAALRNRGTVLHGLGQCAAALVAFDEAIARYQDLIPDDPDELKPGLALALTSHGDILCDLGQLEAALGSYEGAAREWWRYVEKERDYHWRSSLGVVLIKMGITQHTLGRLQTALESFDQAIIVFRRLSEENADLSEMFDAHLAYALNIRGHVLGDLTRWGAALKAYDEVILLCRGLSGMDHRAVRRGLLLPSEVGNPELMAPRIAAGLMNRGDVLAQLGQREAMRMALDEADTLCQTDDCAPAQTWLRRIRPITYDEPVPVGFTVRPRR